MALIVSSTTDDQKAVNAAAGLEEAPVEEAVKPTPPEPDEDESDDEPEEQEENAQVKPKAKGGFQRKIERLIAANEARDRRIAELEAERMRYIQPPQDRQQRQPEAERPPRAEDFPNDYESYNRAIIRYEARQELDAELRARVEAQRQAQEQKAQQEIDERWHKGVGALRRELPDFEEALESVSHIPVQPWLQMAIKRDPNGSRLAYELARHPEEFERIAQIPDPLEAISALGEFRASIKATMATPRKQVSEAPAPIRPVGQSASGTRTAKDPGEMPYQDYKRWRLQQIARDRGQS